ncbi:MAG: choice-of-anchor D domain-containing protein [Candidatus Polarisedimenticolia bacterium]
MRASSVFLVAVVAVLGSSTPGHAESDSAPRVPNEILIKFSPGSSLAAPDTALALVGGTRLRTFASGAEHWRTGPGVSTEAAMSLLQAHPQVEYVEPNYIVSASAAPNDPSYGLLWGLHNTGQTGGTPGADIDAEAVWNILTGSRSVVVGVIDTGIDPTHPDLAANMWTNPGEIPGNHVDDDHNGYVDDVRGWDFINEDNDPFDDHSHGTHVAGTIGAVGNNGIGVAGVNWAVSLVGLKFLSAGGSGNTADAIEAVEYATAMGLDMTNNSWGGGGFSQALLDAIVAADAANCLFVAAAGNSGANMDVSPHYPAGYNAPNIISVAATDHRDARASFSNYGLTTVDLGAPGVDVYSSVPGAAYAHFSGTSMASPHVTGVVALMRAKSPGLAVAALKRALLDSTDPIPALAGITVSGGRLNAVRAIALLDNIPPGAISDLSLSDPTSASLTLSWTATGDDGATGTASAYDIRYATIPLDETNFDSAARAPVWPDPGPAGSAQTVEVLGLQAATTYHLAVKAIDDGSNRGPISNLVSGTTLPPPTLFSAPSDFTASLLTGQTTTRSLTIANVGDGSLDWTIPLPHVGAAYTARQSGFVGPGASASGLSGNDPPGGLEFSWRDLVTTGTLIESLDGDDQTSEPILLGFDFPFYGERFNAVRVSTNGFLSFTSDSMQPANQSLPSAAAPGNLLAAFWDDLDFSQGGRAYYARGEDAFIVQFEGVRSASGSGSYDFEVILQEGGDIVFQYLSMTGPLDGATVGIQDATGAHTLQACFDSPCVGDNLAIGFSATPQWLSVSPQSGRIWNGQQQEVTLTLDASGLGGGTYTSAVVLSSNDPLQPSVAHPVTLMVTDAPAIAAGPAALDFGTIFVGYGSSRAVTVANTGTLELVADLTTGDATVTVSHPRLVLAPGQSQQVAVTVTALAAGPVDSWVAIESNASNASRVEIPLTASAIPPPGLSVDPASYSEHLLTGAKVTRSLRLTNTGGSDLLVTLTADLSTLHGGLKVAPPGATIPAGAWHDFTVTFDASGSNTDVHFGAVVIQTNVPDVPTLTVSAVMSVTAAPDIRIGGQPEVVQSVASYSTDGGSTSHSLPITVSPAGPGTLELIADGDYGFPGETATARVEGTVLGAVGGTSSVDCAPASGSFALSASRLLEVAGDGVVLVDVQNSLEVNVFCAVNQHTIRLTYQGASDHLDFGSPYTGVSRSLSLTILNAGFEALQIPSISSDLPEFVPSVGSLALGPGMSALLTVTFTPSSVASYQGTITIASNDADTPVAGVQVSGAGLDPPVLGVTPSSLESALLSGEQETLALTVSNGGGSPLEFEVQAQPRVAGRLHAVPFGGLSVPVPGASNNPPLAEEPAATQGEGEYIGVVGDFDLLRSSPTPLTCVVEDPATGMLYGQANQGTGFFRYRSSTDTWETLASSPIHSGNNGGAALLNGKIYTSYTGNGASLGVYDVASDSWTVRSNPLGLGTGIIASDGVQYLYMLVDTYFLKFDPSVQTVTWLSAPPFFFNPWGGMRHLSGVLYAHQGDGGRGFASYEVATDSWTTLPLVPSGAVLGSALDPFRREYFAYGTYGGNNLYSYSIDDRIWSVASIPFFAVNDGGLGWLPFPAGVVMVQGESGSGLARYATGPEFLRVSPAVGVVPPFSSTELQVTFDAAGLFGGVYLADLGIVTNDPVNPLVTVPATLTVTGRPIILVGGPVSIVSTISYTDSGASTSHSLLLPSSPAGGGSLELVADGDYGVTGETATVTAETLLLGSVGETGSDCVPATRAFPLSASELASLAEDGLVSVHVQNSGTVDAFCELNRHRVKLSYDSPTDRLDFGSSFIGLGKTISVGISNTGTEVLHVGPISSSLPQFLPSETGFDLAPGTSRTLEVTFTPTAAVEWNATLSISSDDQDRPVVILPMTGLGLIPPVASVSPEALTSSLLSGEQETQVLTVLNDGGSPLTFSIRLEEHHTGARSSSIFGGLSHPQGASNNPAPGAGPGDDGTTAGETYLGAPGTFDLLRASPAPLTCIVEDPAAGILYAQANQGSGFFRYLAATDVWETLAPAPIHSGNNGGAALLNGKIYTSYADRSTVGVYDIASGSWTTLEGPLSTGTASITSDGAGLLYMAVGLDFVQFDPVTGSATALPSPPFYMEKWGGMKRLAGVLYAHQGNGLTGFASYDIAMQQWTLLPSVPSGAVLGAAIDPLSRHYYTYGAYGGRNLYSYAMDTRIWSVATIPFFAVSDGGLGWLPSPAGIHFVQGEPGTGLARLVTQPGFVRVSPSEGTVPASGSLDLEVTFDAANRNGGVYEAEILVISNDPVRPLLSVPATLSVTGRPDISVAGEPVNIVSTVPYTTSGATTLHALPVTVPKSGGAVLSIQADGDYGDSSETASLTAEGTHVGAVGSVGADCTPAIGSFPLTDVVFDTLVADGVVNVTVQNSGNVDTFCAPNQHTIRLTYASRGDALEFGNLLLGLSRSLGLVVANRGTDILHVTSVSSDRPAFIPSIASFDLAPGDTRIVTVIFAPSVPGAVSGTLSIASDDPLTPVESVALSGSGVEPPVIGVEPSEMNVTVPVGTTATRILTLANTGAGPLDFSLHVEEGSPAPGEFTNLGFSPTPLTCIVEDPATATLYGQQNSGFGFYRYSTASNTWLALRSSPVYSGNNGGAALLNGRIYTSYTENAVLGVYDIASDSWTTIPNPLGTGTANIASDGTRYLYLVAGTTFARLDPAAGSTTLLPAPPLSFERWGGMRHLNGILYAHQGNGLMGFASFNISTNTWTVLAPLPRGAVAGAAISTVTREYYAYGSYSERNLYRYSIDSRTWSMSTIPLTLFTAVNDGGLGWLSSPIPGLYLIQGENALGFGRMTTGARLVELDVTAGTVPPHESTDINALFNGHLLPVGAYAGRIKVQSNDPVNPQVVVPVTMQVVFLPRMVVTGASVTLESSEFFRTSGARTSHLLPIPGMPVGDGTLELIAQGDFRSPGQTASLSAEGLEIGSAGGTGLSCSPATDAFAVPEAVLEGLIADGVMSLDVQNSPEVSGSCGASSHTVRLTYPTAPDRLDYGPQAAGSTSTLALRISNVGSGALHISSIASSHTEFVPDATSLVVGPGESATLSVSFTPPAVGSFAASLTLQSDDPESPHLVIPMSGSAVAPPVAAVEPASLESVLLSGTQETRTLTLSNTGPIPLHFTARASMPVQVPFLSVSPSGGVVPAGGSALLSVVVDTRPAPVGTTVGAIQVVTDDPLHRLLDVPVSLRVIGVPSIRLTTGTTTVESTVSFHPIHGETSHMLVLPEPPGGSGRFELVATGDFNAFGRSATARIEGVSIGTVGTNFFGGCTTVQKTFNIIGSQLSFFAEDGVIHATVHNSDEVTIACDPSSHTVRLSYHHPAGELDHGETMMGDSSSRTLFIENVGNDVLTVSSIASDSPAFTVSSSGAVVPPAGMVEIVVTFSPVEVGAAGGTLSFSSDDRDRPLVQFPMTGTGSLPPVIGVMPAALEATLRDPDQEIQALTVSNTGMFPLSFSLSVADPAFVAVTPSSGVVPMSGSTEISVVFDPSSLAPGQYETFIDVASNDPLTPLVRVPVSLYALGEPMLAVLGVPVTLERSRTYTTAGARSTQRIFLSSLPAAGGELTVTVEGEFGGADETAAVDVEGLHGLTLGGAGGSCASVSHVIPLSPEDMLVLTSDHFVTVTTQNSPQVGVSCPTNRHAVSLMYRSVAEQVDFGSIFTGATAVRSIAVENHGTDVLHVASIAADLPEFSADPAAFSLPPGGFREVTLTFAPSSAADFSGSLVIDSDDVASPVLAIPITGTGLPAPVLEVQPASMSVTLVAGTDEAQTLTVSNPGESDLEVSLSARTTGPVAFLAVSPLSATVPPGESMTFSVHLDTAGLAMGSHVGAIDVSSNDPVAPLVSVPVTLTVVPPPVAELSPAALVAALPPGGATTRALRVSNSGASQLIWTLGGPDAGGAALLPLWIAASSSGGTLTPGTFTDIILTLSAATLADGDHTQTVCVYSNDPVRSRLDATVAVHVGEVSPELFMVEPASLSLQANGNTVKATLQLGAGLDPHEVILDSVRLNGVLGPIVSKTSFADENGDGLLELILKFDRAAFQSLVPEGQSVPVAITGEVRDRTWFRGTTTIRMIRPKLTAPNGGEYLLAGQPVPISWLPAPVGSPLYDVILSRDAGESWEAVASGLTATSLSWTPSQPATSQARIRVLAHDSHGVMGYDESDTSFTIAGQLMAPHGVSTLQLTMEAGGGILMTWERPGVDAAHGPASHYRVLSSLVANGTFIQLGTPAAESWNEPASTGGAGIVYYKIVAVNAAGESSD